MSLELSLNRFDERLRAIAQLQQKARALESEIAGRKRPEERLAESLVRLAEADQRKDQFLAMLGHELRNPLSPLASALQLLDRIDPPSPDVARIRQIMWRQVRQLTRLIEDLLDVTRIKAGKITLRREPLDLDAPPPPGVASRPSGGL